MTSLPDSDAGVELSPFEVKELLPAVLSGEILLVDCREEEEWRFNRLPGAIWMPLSRFGEFPIPEIPAIIYCHHGMRSLRATSYFRSKGSARSWSMSGGIEQWSLEIDPEVPRY